MEHDLFAKLCHIAVNYIVFLREPIPATRLVGNNLLAKALHVSWADCIKANPKLRGKANRVIGLVRRYRKGKITLERAFTQITRLQRSVV